MDGNLALNPSQSTEKCVYEGKTASNELLQTTLSCSCGSISLAIRDAINELDPTYTIKPKIASISVPSSRCYLDTTIPTQNQRYCVWTLPPIPVFSETKKIK